MDPPHYVVLLGNVGSGKSTVVEKLSGQSGLSSDADTSATTESQTFAIPGKLMISDTPGSNAMSDKFMHNMWIAEAMNFRPVSLVLNIVKADTRIDNVVEQVTEYAEGFGELPIELFAVCITHMDKVNWTRERFAQLLHDQTGIADVVFSEMSTPGESLTADILNICKHPQDITVDSENFLKMFKINDKNIKILRSVKKEIADFETMRQEFYHAKDNFSPAEQIDLFFEFQAWLNNEIIEAQKRVSGSNSFEFAGKKIANEAGHIANMTNKVKAILLDVRTQCLGYQADSGVSDLRRCPHCGLVWAKLEGCDGDTTCGNLMQSRENRYGQLATFSFQFQNGHLNILKSGTKPVEPSKSSQQRGVGCGKTINWKQMAPVQLPPEFTVEAIASVDDVKLLPTHARATWNDTFRQAQAKTKMKVTTVQK